MRYSQHLRFSQYLYAFNVIEVFRRNGQRTLLFKLSLSSLRGYHFTIILVEFRDLIQIGFHPWQATGSVPWLEAVEGRARLSELYLLKFGGAVPGDFDFRASTP